MSELQEAHANLPSLGESVHLGSAQLAQQNLGCPRVAFPVLDPEGSDPRLDVFRLDAELSWETRAAETVAEGE